MANPTVILLALLLVLLSTSHSALRLGCKTKDGTAQQCGNKAKPYQIAFHAPISLMGAKIVQIELKTKNYFPNLACTTLTT